MGLYLPGADIHDFLACLGKHAVEKASFGFSDLKTVEPESCNIVFVEDTDEFTHCADGFGLANKEEKEAAPGGWGKSIQKEDNPGWGAEPNSEAKNDAMPSDTGWAMAESCLLEGNGWGDEQAAVKNNGWGSMEKTEVDKAAPEGGWGSKQEATSDNGWDSLVKSDVHTTASAAQTDNWGSMEGQNPSSETSKGGFMHPSRRSMNAADSTENPGAIERQSGNFAPSGSNTVPLGKRKRFVKADVDAALTNDEQCKEKDHMGWGATAPSAAGDDFGWGGNNQEEKTQQGSGEDNWASGMDWKTSCSDQPPASQNSKCDSLDKDAWQTVPESEMLGMNGWGNDNHWNCKGNSEAYETAPSNPPDSWDAMEGQNARKGSKRLADVTDRTQKQSADEWRSGKFAPSGSNTIPLGKRTAMKPNDESESMMMKSAQPSGGKEDQVGWANCEQTTAAEDVAWDNSNQEEKETCKKDAWQTVPESEMLGMNGWGNDNDWNCKGNSEAYETAPPNPPDSWDAMEGQNARKGSKRLAGVTDRTHKQSADEWRSGKFAPSGSNTIPLGKRTAMKPNDESESTMMKSTQPSGGKEDQTGWANCEQTTAAEDVAWDNSNQEEKETCEKDAWQTVPESEMLGMNGWGNDNDWNCKGNSEAYETAPSNPPDSWDAMEGQNARKGSKRLADATDRTQKQSADERRSGKFAPSGSNTIPLGKRTAMKPNDKSESMMMKITQPSGGKEDQTGWATNCEQTTAAEDVAWDNSNQEEKETCEKSFEKGLGMDGCESDSKCGEVSTGQTNQGMENDSIGKGDWNSQFKGEASANLHGWGSEVQIKNVQDDGWDDIKSDSPSVPCSNNRPKPSPSSWDSAGFKPSDTQQSRGSVGRDETPRPRKNFNRDSSSDPWTGFASKRPQPPSRRPRLRSLMNSPEYSELDELYKATNKILHHNEYQIGDKLNTEDEEFILQKILVHHQDKEAKVGCGVDYVMIDSHAEHQVSCFWVVRKDGSKTDFSYWKCLEGLYETKYSQGATKDGVKNETNDGWNRGTNSKASAQSDQGGEKGSSHTGGSSGAPTKGIWDKGNMKGSWDMGVSSAGPSSWNMGASSAVPTKTTCDEGDGWDTWAGSASPSSWNIGPSSAVPTKAICDEGDGWDTWAGSAAPTQSKCDQEEAKDSGDMGANPAANVCDQATRKDVPQEEAKDGWEGL